MELIIKNDVLLGFTGEADSSVVIPGHVVEIAPMAFFNAENLTNAKIPASCKIIGHHAFCGTSLEAVRLPDGVEVEKCAFFDCKYLKQVKLDGKVSRVGDCAFGRTPFFEKQHGLIVLGNCLLGMSEESSFDNGTFHIPAGIDVIADNAFEYYYKAPTFTEVIFSNRVRIGKHAFAYRDDLKKIVIGERCTINDYAFYGCSNLNTVDWDDNVLPDVDFGEFTFAHTKLEKEHFKAGDVEEYKELTQPKKVVLEAEIDPPVSADELPNSVVLTKELWNTLYSEMLEARKSNSKITADKSILTVIISYEHAPREWEFMEVITAKYPCATSYRVDSNSTYQSVDGVLFNIGRYHTLLVAFPPARKGHYIVPTGVTIVSTYAFYRAKIKSVSFSDKVYRLDGGAFFACNNLAHIHIPSGLYQIDDQTNCSPFEQCKNLETITVAPENDHLYSFDGILYDAYGHLLCCPAGKNGKLVLPNTCHGIDKYALSGCQKITSIILPEKDFYYLDHGCMRDCTSLEELIIPKSILRIEERVFFNCSKMKRIVVLTDKNVFCNEFDLSPFENCHKKLVIVGLPGSDVEAYANEQNIGFEPYNPEE